MFWFSQKNRRLIVTIVALIFVANLIFLPVHIVRAQFMVSAPGVEVQVTIQVIREYLKKIFVGIAGVGLTNALNYFMQKIAYDLAVGIATGGKGQMPLFSSKGWGDYMKDTGLNAVGEFVGSLSEDFGVDLCSPGTPAIQLRIQTGLFDAFLPVGEAPRPKCTWNEISRNWEQFTEEFTSGDVLRTSGVIFEQGQSPLSIALQATRNVAIKYDTAQEAAKLEREEGGGFTSVMETISQRITTPGALIKKKAETLTETGEEQQKEQSSSLSRSISTGSFQILTSALGTFVNTLAGKLLENVFSGLFSISDMIGSGGKRAALINPEFTLVGTREVAQRIFADFITPPIKEVETYDLVTEFSACPSQFANLNNCVIDHGFAEAVRREQTGSPLSIKEAVDQGLLHGDWPLISSYDRARNTDTFCYTYGYCYSNLVKLRKARIIPIGWEIAAQKSGTVTSQATLKQVMNSFHDCGVDSEGSPIADASHPWCHLIDPNWIIKYPQTQCRAMVYGPTLVSTDSDMRTEMCVDAPSCIAEDDEGNCVGGWGYCLREKNTWHFDGDICPARYESCLTLEDRFGVTQSMLLNSVNYDACNADNVGCRWYSREKALVGDEWQWQATTSYRTTDDTLVATQKAIYFDKDVGECDAADAGCTEMVRASASGVTLNLVANPSFENPHETDVTLPDKWAPTTVDIGVGPRTYDTSGDHAAEGTDSIIPGGLGIHQYVVLNPSRFYTISVYTRNAPAATNQLYSGIEIMQSDGTVLLQSEADLDNYYFSGANCIIRDFPSTGGQAFAFKDPDPAVIAGIVPPEDYTRYVCTFTTPGEEKTGTVGKYFFGRFYIYGNVYVDAVQVEESEILTAYHEGIGAGAEKTYLKKPPAYLGCRGQESDPGECGEYLRPCDPMDVGCKMYYPENGDPVLAAVTTSENTCPVECVGYETYREEPTQWSTGAIFPLFFIPDTAKVCAANQVGCDEFTNLDAPEVGGESRNYFTEIRACQKPATDSETFYTWEGSDTTGYQLKTWVLKGSNLDDGPCTTLAPGGVCRDTVPQDCSDVYGINADCRQFYNTAGDLYYRFYSDTVVSTEECYRYRKTENTGQTDCEGTGGTWTTEGECIYMGYPAESVGCPVEAAGCRAYTGPGSRNIEQQFLDDFEDATNQGWEGGTPSTESITLGGHSLKIARGTAATKEWAFESERTYIVSFWAKGAGNASLRVDGTAIGSVSLGAEWNYFEIGPILVGAVGATPTVTLDGASLTQDSYFDTILLKKVTDHIYLLRNSWYTPISCDMNNQSVYIPQAQLGCEAYKDAEDATYYFKSFDRLCSDEAVGCEGFIDTYNSAATTLEIFRAGEDGAQVIVPPDTMSYYVYDDNFSCTQDVKGCEKLGRPKLAKDGRSVESYEDVYLINDPEAYDEILCGVEDAYCDEFSSETGKYYFKHPGEKLCEWKEKVKVAGIEYNGWFKKGTEEPCYPAYLGGGNTYGLWKNGDAAYDGWVGTCPDEYSTCTKFTDPSDTSTQYPKGKEYYYLNNGSLDQTCTAVSKREGCALFDNASVSTKDYNSWATFMTSEDQNYAAVPAVDCRSSDNPYCTKVCQYETHGISYYTHNCRDISSCPRPSGFLYGCVDINTLGGKCRSWDDEEEMYMYRGTCTTDDDCTFSGDWTCVQMPQELRRNDTNMVLRVRRDRECGEWLGCRSSASVWDSETSQYKNICTNLGLCDQYAQVGESSECVNFIESEHTRDVLTAELYSSRSISWEGMDYSGYAIPNYYSIDELEPVDLSRLTGSGVPDIRLGYIDPDITVCTRGQACGSANALGNRGLCVDGSHCVYSINGEVLPASSDATELYNLLNTTDNKLRLVGPSCRAYPEESSPFPSTVATWENGKITAQHPDFKRASVCEQALWQDFDNDNERDANELTYQDCDCDYQKVTYGNGAVTKYYSLNETNIPTGICLNGPRDGLPCVPGIDYNDEIAADSIYNQQTCGSIKSGGSCQPLERKDSFVGWQGQCLEHDLRTTLNNSQSQNACLTWHPSYIVAGGQDIYNLYQGAGYNPANTGRYWCAMAKGNRERVPGLGEDYLLMTRWNSKDSYEDGPRYSELVWGGNTTDTSYEERWMPALPREKLNLDEIIAIELVVAKAEAGDWPNGRNSHTNEFYKDGNNILSREKEILLPDGWRVWETTWNLADTKIPSTNPPVFTRPSFIKFSGYKEYNSACGWQDHSPKNYFAVRAVFDDKGLFRGFWGAGCDDSKNKGWVRFKIIFHLAENCEVVAGVMDEMGNAKAYTDRLYQSTGYNLIFEPGMEYAYDQTFAPFGSGQSIESPTLAPAPGAYAWIAGDNLKENNLMGTPDLSYFGENYTLGGSPLACGSECGKDGGTPKFFSRINRTTLADGLVVLRQLFTKIQSLFYWLPGMEEKTCQPTAGDWPYIINCGEESDCDTTGSCAVVPECVGGVFNGADCNEFEYVNFSGDEATSSISDRTAFCQGNEAQCLRQDLGDGSDVVEAFQCFGSVRQEEDCGEDSLPDNTGTYNSIGGSSVTVRTEADKRNNEVCYAQGLCINWNQFESGEDPDWRCYGSIKHGDRCSSDTECNSMGVCDKATKLCKGAWERLGITRSCVSDTDCSLESHCSSGSEVMRCTDGVMEGARCEEDTTICTRDLTCKSKYDKPADTEDYGYPEQVRGYVDKVCTRSDGFQALNNPCQTNDDCIPGLTTCEYVNLSAVFGIDSGFNFSAEIEDADASDTGTAPTVAAIDFTKCDQATGTCRVARLNAFDINNWYYGIIMGQDQIKATMRFYAWADHDQMPIVSRTIDWGDGSPLDRTTLSKYKNQKPYCGADVWECSAIDGLTCKSTADCPPEGGSCVPKGSHFGNDPAACAEGYFQFEHTFICDGSAEDLPDCGFSSDSPPLDVVIPRSNPSDPNSPIIGCKTGTACYFRPRIQVQDNWGWCNADTPCAGRTSGCYAGTTNECDVTQERYPHWTSYDGYIKVNK